MWNAQTAVESGSAAGPGSCEGDRRNGRDQRAACERLLFNLYLVPCWLQSWDQSRKWKHMARVSRIRGPPHTLQRKGEEGNGNLWEELDWINRVMRSPAPHYPMIYTAWELGHASHWRRPTFFFFFREKWHSMPHANQKSRHYSLRQVWNSFKPNVFILNIQGKLLHQWQAMSPEQSGLLKFPAANIRLMT